MTDSFNIDTIRWRARALLGMGGYACVYRVAPGVVAKVGRIEPDEADVQRYFAAIGRALPVYDYRAQVAVPAAVSREVCPRHGPRRDIVLDGDCGCGEYLDVMLMAEADPVEVDTAAEAVTDFMNAIGDECIHVHQRAWDARPANVARYQGQLVALDFGEEDL